MARVLKGREGEDKDGEGKGIEGKEGRDPTKATKQQTLLTRTFD